TTWRAFGGFLTVKHCSTRRLILLHSRYIDWLLCPSASWLPSLWPTNPVLATSDPRRHPSLLTAFSHPAPPWPQVAIGGTLFTSLAAGGSKMTRTISRRNVLAPVGFSALAGQLTSEMLHAQSLPARAIKDDYKEDFFYREDWLGEPWRKAERVVLIHGNDESSVEWYAWVPRMGQEYRLIRPDLPGLGHSILPRGFEYSLANLATFVTKVMDRAGV